VIHPEGRSPSSYFALAFRDVVSTVTIGVTLSPALSEAEGVAKGLGVVGVCIIVPGPVPRFFVAEFILSQASVLLRMIFDTKPLLGEGGTGG